LENDREKYCLVSVLDRDGGLKRKILLMSQFIEVVNRIPGLKVLGMAREGNEPVIYDQVDLINLRKVSGYTTVVEVVKDEYKLYVFGAGHVGKAVAILGKLIGYQVIVLDDRESFLADIEKLSLNVRVVDYSSLLVEIDNESLVVIVTRGHQYDEACLRYVMQANAKYVGMIGSKRRILSIYKKLEGSGVLNSKLQTVYAPIGIEIGAKSPMEIAISILAQVISVVNR
jgi:xanthine dehydrogenase accessory factor